MKKRNKTILIIILGIIIISNLPPIYYFIGEEYHYQNADGSFSFTERAGTIQNFQMAQLKFKSFVEKNPKSPHILYRTFSLNPSKFWEWGNAILNFDRFKLKFYTKS